MPYTGDSGSMQKVTLFKVPHDGTSSSQIRYVLRLCACFNFEASESYWTSRVNELGQRWKIYTAAVGDFFAIEDTTTPLSVIT